MSPSLRFVDQCRQSTRIVTKIRIHFHDEPISERQCLAKCMQVRLAEPSFFRAMKHTNPRLRQRKLVRELSRSVGRIVVDHEHIDALIRRENRTRDGFDVVTFVVRGNANERAFGERIGR